MSGINKQNSWILILGIILIILYFVLTQLRNILPIIALKKTNSQKINNNNLNNNQYTTLLEPGLFEIKIPENFNYSPYKAIQEIPDPEAGESLNMPYYRYQSPDGINTYEIGYIRFPEQKFQIKTHEQILNDLTQGEISRIQAILRKEITINKSTNYSSREIHLESINASVFSKELLIINRPYIYIISFSSKNKTNINSPKTEKYFNSFLLFDSNNVFPKTIIMNSSNSLPIE